MLDLDRIDIASLEINGINHRDAPDYCDAYYSKGSFIDGTEMTDDQLENLKDISPDLFYELLTNTIH